MQYFSYLCIIIGEERLLYLEKIYRESDERNNRKKEPLHGALQYAP